MPTLVKGRKTKRACRACLPSGNVVRRHSEPVRHHFHLLLTRQLHLVPGQRRHQRLVVEELVRSLYGLRGERVIQRAGHQLQSAVVVVVQERERFAVVQRPPPLAFGQPQRESALRLGRFCFVHAKNQTYGQCGRIECYHISFFKNCFRPRLFFHFSLNWLPRRVEYESISTT